MRMAFKNISKRALVASIVIPFLLCVVMAGSMGTAHACATVDSDVDRPHGDVDEAQSLCAEPEPVPELPFLPLYLLGISSYALVEIGIFSIWAVILSLVFTYLALRKKKVFYYYYYP
jgi:hypothetical protein